MFWNNNEKNPENQIETNKDPAVLQPKLQGSKEPEVLEESLEDKRPLGCLERYGKIRSALGPGTVIQGKLSFDTPVRIDGKLSGEVFSTNVLIIGESGSVEAEIDASSLIIMGKVRGHIRVAERVEIHPGGSVDGDIDAPCFVVHEGASFNGKCAMGSAATVEARPARESNQEADKGDERRASTLPKPTIGTSKGPQKGNITTPSIPL